VTSAEEVVPGLTPENELERAVAGDAELVEGLRWGKPRKSHPEGPVAAHVRDLLTTLEDWDEPEPRRSELRFITLVHDAQKNKVKSWLPASGENHHAMRARRLAERYTSDERLLATIELHDRPYALWKKMTRKGELDNEAFAEMVARVPDRELFLRFVELDGSTEGKDPEPIRWLHEELRRRGAIAG
jgi:hypothetical protein